MYYISVPLYLVVGSYCWPYTCRHFIIIFAVVVLLILWAENIYYRGCFWTQDYLTLMFHFVSNEWTTGCRSVVWLRVVCQHTHSCALNWEQLAIQPHDNPII
jgi:hypothetical protein